MTAPGEFIVKLQRPMATTERVPTAKVYNEDRSLDTAIPLYMVRRVFARDALKVYYYATLHNGTLALDRPAPEQTW